MVQFNKNIDKLFLYILSHLFEYNMSITFICMSCSVECEVTKGLWWLHQSLPRGSTDKPHATDRAVYVWYWKHHNIGLVLLFSIYVRCPLRVDFSTVRRCRTYSTVHVLQLDIGTQPFNKGLLKWEPSYARYKIMITHQYIQASFLTWVSPIFHRMSSIESETRIQVDHSVRN